jgi:hypothetical protein
MAHRRDGQRLERREEGTGCGAGEAGMATAAHRRRDRGPSGDGERLPQGGRRAGSATARLGPTAAVKSGQRGVHRPRPRGGAKSGQRGVHRPGVAAAAGTGAVGERLGAIPGDGREGDRVGPERDGDLAGAQIFWQVCVRLVPGSSRQTEMWPCVPQSNGRFSFLSSAAQRGSPCSPRKSGSQRTPRIPVSRWATARSSHSKARSRSPRWA